MQRIEVTQSDRLTTAIAALGAMYQLALPSKEEAVRTLVQTRKPTIRTEDEAAIQISASNMAARHAVRAFIASVSEKDGTPSNGVLRHLEQNPDTVTPALVRAGMDVLSKHWNSDPQHMLSDLAGRSRKFQFNASSLEFKDESGTTFTTQKIAGLIGVHAYQAANHKINFNTPETSQAYIVPRDKAVDLIISTQHALDRAMEDGSISAFEFKQINDSIKQIASVSYGSRIKSGIEEIFGYANTKQAANQLDTILASYSAYVQPQPTAPSRSTDATPAPM